MKQKTKPHNRLPVAVIAVCVLGVGALAGYAKFGPANRVPQDQLRPASRQEQGKTIPSPPNVDGKVKVLTPVYQGDDLVFKEGHETPPASEDKRTYAINAYLKSISAVPTGAKAVSVRVDKGIATVDFTSEFDAGYGLEDERTIVEGILTTLGQFNDIEAVSFEVAGKPLESLGHLDLSTPQKVMHRPEIPAP